MDGVFHVYVLEGPRGRYIGCSSDLTHRLTQHNAGRSPSTKNRGPWKVQWQSIGMSHEKALALEKLMKLQKGGDGLRKLMMEYGGS